jgi:hypothetical protein
MSCRHGNPQKRCGEQSHRAGRAALQAEAWNVLFVAPGRVGPFTLSGVARGAQLDRIACELSLRDAGSGDRLVAKCFAMFRPITRP